MCMYLVHYVILWLGFELKVLIAFRIEHEQSKLCKVFVWEAFTCLSIKESNIVFFSFTCVLTFVLEFCILVTLYCFWIFRFSFHCCTFCKKKPAKELDCSSSPSRLPNWVPDLIEMSVETRFWVAIWERRVRRALDHLCLPPPPAHRPDWRTRRPLQVWPAGLSFELAVNQRQNGKKY